MSGNRICFLVMIAILISGCGKSDLATSRLRASLQGVNLQHPALDLDAAMKSGDRRFVCVYGVTELAPGVESPERTVLERQGMRCIEGTSDAIESAAHEQLMRQAIGYAREYNVELLRRIDEAYASPGAAQERARE